MDEHGEHPEDPIEVPIDGILDLHTFQPQDLKTLVPDYLDLCRQQGILQVRIIHGKGKGVLRRSVHAILDKLPEVESYQLASDRSSWGATLVFLAGADNEGATD